MPAAPQYLAVGGTPIFGGSSSSPTHHESTRACAGAGGLETQTCSEGARGYNAVPPAASVAFEPGPADANVGVTRAGVGPSETSSLMLSALSVQRPQGFPGSGMQVQSAVGGFPAAHRRRRDLDQRPELGHRTSALLAQVGDHLARGYESGGLAGEVAPRPAPAGVGRAGRSIRERLLDLTGRRRRVDRRWRRETRSRLRPSRYRAGSR